MKTLLLLAATALSASPAVAQHAGHAMPGMTVPAPKAKPAAKKPSAQTAPARKPVARRAPAAKAPAKKPAATRPAAKPAAKAGDHRGHDMSAMPAPQAPAQPDPHAGHDGSAMPGMEMPADPAASHASHGVAGPPDPEPQPGPTPPEALTGPEWAADAFWPEQPRSRETLSGEHGTTKVGRVLVDRAETRVGEGRDGYLLDIQAWYGGDTDKLWTKAEIEGPWRGKIEHAEVQLLWSHAIAPFFDLQTGVRYDPGAGPDRGHLVLGIEGLAPYWWDVEGTVFLSGKGDVTARAEGEHDLRITQELVLQPRAEINIALQDVPDLAIGSGLTNASLGLRLRYQVSPLVAPYVGVEYERAFGDTRRMLRAEGEKPAGVNLLAGIRFWF